jgi:hypothetical protein
MCICGSYLGEAGQRGDGIDGQGVDTHEALRGRGRPWGQRGGVLSAQGQGVLVHHVGVGV